MNYFTYILESHSAGKLYIGQTADLEKRILRHNSGGSTYTRNKGPWELLYSIGSQTRSEAILLERKLKGFKNPTKVKEWIKAQQKV